MKKAKKAPKEQKEKKEKQSFRQVASNTLYMLKILHKVAPRTLYFSILSRLVSSTLGFFSWTMMIRRIINFYQEGKPFLDTIWVLIALLAVSYVWDILDILFRRLIQPMDALKLEQYINEQIYEKIGDLELACYENPEFYDRYVRVAADAKGRVDAVLRSVCDVAGITTSLSLNGFLVLTVDPVLFIFAVIPLVTTFIIARKDNTYLFEYNMEMAVLGRQRDYTRRTFYLSDYAKEMRLSSIGNVMMQRFHRTIGIIEAFMKKKLPFHAFLRLMMISIRNILCYHGASLYAVFRTIVSGTIRYGDCLVIIDTISRLSYCMSNIGDTAAEFQGHSLYVNNLRDFLEYQPKIADGPLPAPEACADLEFHDVHFRYDGQEKETIRGVNLRIRAGEKIALVGLNGAGKTTLAKLMLRLYDPTDGVITYGGNDVRSYEVEGKNGYRERISVVFQDFKLFAMSVADNILLRERQKGDDTLIAEAMQHSGIAEKVQTLPEKENTLLTREFDENGTVLSGGEGQKIAIARTFAKDAQLVILDEPSSALDPIAEYKMYENMMQVCEGKSVVFISHRLSSATLADTIYFLENGQVIEQGTHQALMAQNGRYAEMFRIQARNYVQEKGEME